MPKRRERNFKTKREADAFVAGVQYVNDSNLSVVAVKRTNRKLPWMVVMRDDDYFAPEPEVVHES